MISYIALAFRTGLRRTEILGLTANDRNHDSIAIRPNELRGLKTRNARRLVPLVALDERARQSLEWLIENSKDGAALFFDKAPTAAELESAPVVAHAKSLLMRVTGDQNLHAHNLRHSAATLHMIGMLGAELRMAGHPYCEPWMRETLELARQVDNAISGALHRKAGRGNAMSMMLGHGSEVTTYEHYVHAFDLLLFIACWSGRFKAQKRRQERYLHPRRKEVAQLLALLGYSPATSVETDDHAALIKRIARLQPKDVEMLEPRPREVTRATAAAKTERTIPTLAELLSGVNPDTKGCPTTQADRDSASMLLDRLEVSARRDFEATHRAILSWVARRRSEADWATFSAADAKNWLRDLGDPAGELPIELQHVTKASGGKKRKSAVRRVTSTADIDQERGSWLLRFADGREKINRRQARTGASRSRSQSAISWTIASVASRLQTATDPQGSTGWVEKVSPNHRTS